MLYKTLAGIGLFAAAGAAIGYSKILCAGGECAITGTPYGGAFFGGVLGLAIMSGINAPASTPTPPAADEPDDDSQGEAESDDANKPS